MFVFLNSQYEITYKTIFCRVMCENGLRISIDSIPIGANPIIAIVQLEDAVNILT
jgi:hypothetical protein